MGFQVSNNDVRDTATKKIIIKGNSPEEIYRKGLEIEQKNKLYDKYNKTTDRNYQKALQYEAARLPAYMDYEGMEYYPIISSALDLFMEEATTMGVDGKVLNIYSNKERIKNILEEFYYEILNVNTNLPFWTRNTPVKFDSMIPLLNGEIITIKDLSERIKKNPSEEIWTYSIQDVTKKIVPGKIVWCDLTRKNSEIVRVTFDDDTYLETTPDHEYMLRDGSYARADTLTEGVSLMPFYTLTSKTTDGIAGYEKVYNPATNRHIFTHRFVAKECVIDFNEEKNVNDKYVTHHIDFNKKNNHPSNLKRMTSSEHTNYHTLMGDRGKIVLQREDVKRNRLFAIDKYLRSDQRKKRLSDEMTGIYPKYFNDYNNGTLHEKHNIIRKNRMTELWSDKEYQNRVKDKMQLKIDNDCLSHIVNIFKNSTEYICAKKLGEILASDTNFMLLFKIANDTIRKDLSKSLSSTTLVKLIFRKTNKTYCDFAKSVNLNFINQVNFKRASAISNARGNKNCVLLNHKVKSVEKISEKFDVYCMEVVGRNNEQDRHNFPVCSKDENGNYTRNGVFLSNCKYGDNFVLLYGERNKGITAVKQMVNYDIERTERVINGKPTIKFKERMTGDEFNTFEIAHFRLLGDDKYIPYGSSMLNKVRRVFRQLIMAEDAMLTYRIIRAGEKKVFKIDVGNMDEDDIEEYMYKVATKFKKTQQVNPNNGQIDYRFNILGNDEDYFLPLRNANTVSGIDTLPGATNLNDIHDIEYLRDNLFIGLGIPKPFLSFQDATGGGKNVAQFDVRFAKKVNRVQKAMVQELTKMGMIHLYLLGYGTEDWNDFTLALANPSSQLDLQNAEIMRNKAQTYAELTRSENGIAAMSHTGAKRLIFNMSDKQIVEDLKQQKMEKVVMQEFADAPVLIKKSGLFTDIDSRYGSGTAIGSASGGTESMPTPTGGGMPPMPMGGEQSPMGGAPQMGAEPQMGGAPAGGLPPMAEEYSKKRKLYFKREKLSEKEFDDHINELVYGKKKVAQSDVKIITETELSNVNNITENMIKEIDGMINDNSNDLRDFVEKLIE